jgi:hypothetical protein
VDIFELWQRVRQEVRNLRQAEVRNWKDGMHLLAGKSDDKTVRWRTFRYARREGRLERLYRLLRSALPAGIAAGFSGEWVHARLEELAAAANEACYWNESYEGPLKDGNWVGTHIDILFSKVRTCVEPLATMAAAVDGAAASAREAAAKGRTPAQKGVPGRRGYPLEIKDYALRLRRDHPQWNAARLRGECLRKFAGKYSDDDLPPDAESFRRWLNRQHKRANRAN